MGDFRTTRTTCAGAAGRVERRLLEHLILATTFVIEDRELTVPDDQGERPGVAGARSHRQPAGRHVGADGRGRGTRGRPASFDHHLRRRWVRQRHGRLQPVPRSLQHRRHGHPRPARAGRHRHVRGPRDDAGARTPRRAGVRRVMVGRRRHAHDRRRAWSAVPHLASGAARDACARGYRMDDRQHQRGSHGHRPTRPSGSTPVARSPAGAAATASVGRGASTTTASCCTSDRSCPRGPRVRGRARILEAGYLAALEEVLGYSTPDGAELILYTASGARITYTPPVIPTLTGRNWHLASIGDTPFERDGPREPHVRRGWVVRGQWRLRPHLGLLRGAR